MSKARLLANSARGRARSGRRLQRDVAHIVWLVWAAVSLTACDTSPGSPEVEAAAVGVDTAQGSDLVDGAGVDNPDGQGEAMAGRDPDTGQARLDSNSPPPADMHTLDSAEGDGTVDASDAVHAADVAFADTATAAEVADAAGDPDIGGSTDLSGIQDVPEISDLPANPDAALDASDSQAPDWTEPAIDVVVLPDVASSAADATTSPQVDPTTLPQAAFVDVTSQYGIEPTKWHEFCVAVADFDDNGHEDFVLVERTGFKATIHASLLGGATIVHVKSPIDTSVATAAFGCSAVDLDGDSNTDLIFGGFAGAAVYLGNGAGGFVDKTAQWMPYLMNYAAFSVQPADLDGDGDLDLYIGAGFEPPPCGGLACKYTASDLICNFATFPPTAKMDDRVLLRGPALPMIDATAAWNVPKGGNQTVVMALDLDEDGKMDILAGDENDGHRLLRNVGGKFAIHDVDLGLHPWAAAMGWAVGDLNADGKLDLVLADAGPSPAYVQVAAKPGVPAQFVDQGGQLGIWGPSWGASAWSPLIADFDLDGLDDLLLAVAVNMSPEELADFVSYCGQTTGKINPFQGKPSIDVLYTHGKGPALQASAMPNGSYAHGLFVDQRAIDLDDDGDLDVVQTRPGPTMMPSARVRILRNDLKTKGNFIRVVVDGKGQNRDALGTRVLAKVNGVFRKRWLNGSGGWGGSSTRFAHFGLGESTKATDVVIAWPDGTTTLLGDVATGTTIKAVWK